MFAVLAHEVKSEICCVRDEHEEELSENRKFECKACDFRGGPILQPQYRFAAKKGRAKPQGLGGLADSGLDSSVGGQPKPGCRPSKVRVLDQTSAYLSMNKDCCGLIVQELDGVCLGSYYPTRSLWINFLMTCRELKRSV